VTRKGMLDLVRSIETIERLFSRLGEVKRERESSERAARSYYHYSSDYTSS
jgi:hypothetical protein